MSLPAHDPESCDRRYVSWFWLVGILIALLGGGITLAWTGGGRSTQLKNTLDSHETRLEKLEIATNKIDTVIAIVKEIRNAKLKH